MGDPLDQVELEAKDALEIALSFGPFLDRVSPPLALVRSLRGKNTFGSLDDGQFTESSFEKRIKDCPNFALMECYYWIRKLQARFFAGDYAAAVNAANVVNVAADVVARTKAANARTGVEAVVVTAAVNDQKKTNVNSLTSALSTLRARPKW